MIRILIFVANLVLATRAAYVNEFDGPLTFKCASPTQTISRVQSIHDNHKEDRRFDFTCRDFLSDADGRSASCYWTPDWQNAFDQPLHFSCRAGHYINGMQSAHDNNKEDRHWKFYCCSIPNIHLRDCTLTGWTNAFDQTQDYRLADNSVMAGVVSVHDNHKEDRRYEYEYCGFYESEGGSLVG